MPADGDLHSRRRENLKTSKPTLHSTFARKAFFEITSQCLITSITWYVLSKKTSAFSLRSRKVAVVSVNKEHGSLTTDDRPCRSF
jgi:hypothetical protein